MQNENNEIAISNNNNHNVIHNATDTAKISNMTLNADSATDSIREANAVASPNNAFSKKIGRTMYTVHIYFSTTSKESFNDKLLRLINNDAANGANGAWPL